MSKSSGRPLEIDAELTLPAQIEARAMHEEIADRVFLVEPERSWTYREFRDQSVRYANFLVSRLGKPTSEEEPNHVAVLMENCLEFLALYGGCGYAGCTLFGINTGLRGDALAGVLNQSRARLLIVDTVLLARIEAVRDRLTHLSESQILVVPRWTQDGSEDERGVPDGRNLLANIEAEVSVDSPPPDVQVSPGTVQMVIYTSGTTGLPKGINNNHLKLLMIGRAVSARLELDRDTCGYSCMPLFHSNAIFLGFQPAFEVGGRIVVRRRFSASEFARDVLKYGVTYWNYVGEPVHYILAALEGEYAGDDARRRRELSEHPDNRFQIALGNGAAPPDIDRFIEWFGLEDMVELYGSTEAAISTFRVKQDPRGSVGEVRDEAVKILDESGRECPAVELDANGTILNYAEAVGEICRVAPDTALFQGYFDNPDANTAKYRGGVYHSGDLGHILVRDGRRFLYFDGRTEDWIRKDGENFSANQVARLLQEHPDIQLAAAYGVPCAVSDELVMVALKLREGASFEPVSFFTYCREQIDHGDMDPKWFPDFVRIVRDFHYTQTQKILVRALRKDHFDASRYEAADPLYWRIRESTRYEVFARDDFEAMRRNFAERERSQLLEA